MEVRTFNASDIPWAAELWNAVMEGAYISPHLLPEEMRSLTFDSENFERDASFTAEDAGEAVGFVLSFFNRPYENDMFWHFAVGGWIGAVIVADSARRKGVGRALIARAEEVHKNKGRLLLFFGGGEGMKNIVPGIEDGRGDLDPFLKAVGYSYIRSTCWIDIAITDYEEPKRVQEKRAALKADGFDVRIATADDEDAVVLYLKAEGTKGWEARLERWKTNPSRWVLAVGPEEIAGTTWDIYLGKAGKSGYYGIHTLTPYRNRGIGTVMLSTAMMECRRLGAQTMPLWTRPATHERFYKKLGFELSHTLDVYCKVLQQDLLSQEWIGRFWGADG